jgi:hypothetical protein
MYESDVFEWDIQTTILKSNGYTTDEINNRDYYDRHMMIRNNCPGYETGDFYYGHEE